MTGTLETVTRKNGTPKSEALKNWDTSRRELFWKRSSVIDVFYNCSKNIWQIHVKEFIFSKVAYLQPVTFLKNRLLHRRFLNDFSISVERLIWFIVTCIIGSYLSSLIAWQVSSFITDLWYTYISLSAAFMSENDWKIKTDYSPTGKIGKS